MNQKDNQSRREFMKQGSILASGMLAAPLFTRANYFSGADQVIKIALIGCGGRGTGAAMQALLTKQNVKLVAMADAFRDRIDSAYKQLNADDLSDWSGLKATSKTKLMFRKTANLWVLMPIKKLYRSPM